MKIWQGYGSEHSSNLVLIGYFKNSTDAQKTLKLIEELQVGLDGKIEIDAPRHRFGEDVLALLRKLECYELRPPELEQFLFDVRTIVEDNKIILTTDEYDVSAFYKLMIENKAKVEIFSTHDYPNPEQD